MLVLGPINRVKLDSNSGKLEIWANTLVNVIMSGVQKLSKTSATE